MRIAIGSDHAGFAAKQAVAAKVAAMGHEIIDFGVESSEQRVDYPDIALKVARFVAGGNADRGILVCGTGIGMSITANKVRGIRAALCHDEFTARMAREHNDANILAMGERTTAIPAMLRIVDTFMHTDFGGERHAARVKKMMDAEEDSGRCCTWADCK
ncbi:MAG: putative sugar phosphate isomerase YwlF [Firmicutes bacterium ADurb.Bin506]|nr:MAG: putative sugar phosphate isomerase YwlF [Firmicutes bacterium ADurb.Bin506]